MVSFRAPRTLSSFGGLVRRFQIERCSSAKGLKFLGLLGSGVTKPDTLNPEP